MQGRLPAISQPANPDYGAPAPGHDRRRCEPGISNLTENLPSREEPIFFRVDGMCLHFDDKLAGHGEDPLQASRRFERRQ